ncbi:MAG: hypothetical protein J5857_08690 [Treponema sp.]|nr:hypothetical protein [Treponema sp.]
MTDREKNMCNGIIHTSSAAAAAAASGLAQIPLSDNAVITPIQLAMVVALGRVFGISLDHSAAEAAVASAGAATIGRAFSQVVIGWVPGLGNAVNASTAAGLTEIMGWIIANEFAKEVG